MGHCAAVAQVLPAASKLLVRGRSASRVPPPLARASAVYQRCCACSLHHAYTELQGRGGAASTSGAALTGYHPNANGGALNRAPRAALQPTANNMQRLEADMKTGAVVRCVRLGGNWEGPQLLATPAWWHWQPHSQKRTYVGQLPGMLLYHIHSS